MVALVMERMLELNVSSAVKKSLRRLSSKHRVLTFSI